MYFLSARVGAGDKMLIKNKWMVQFLLLNFSGTTWASDGTEMPYMGERVSDVSSSLKKSLPYLSAADLAVSISTADGNRTNLQKLWHQHEHAEHAPWLLSHLFAIGAEIASCYMSAAKYTSTHSAQQWIQGSRGVNGSCAAQVAMLHMGTHLP